MDNNDLEYLKSRIDNIKGFSKKHSNSLNKDSAPLWTYAKDKYGLSLDAVLFNDIFQFLSFLGLSDDKITDEELAFINYILDLNFTKEDFIDYLNTNLDENFKESLPSSFIFFYEFDCYVERNGNISENGIVESLYATFEEIGLKFIALENQGEIERNAFDSYMKNLRANLNDLAKFNYKLACMALNSNLLEDIFSADKNNNISVSLDSLESGSVISDIDPSSPDVLIDKLNDFFNKNSHIDLGDIFYNDPQSFTLGVSDSSNSHGSLEAGSTDYADLEHKGTQDKSDSKDIIMNESDENSQEDLKKTQVEEIGEEEDEESLEDVLEKLNKLVGLETVKDDVNSLINLIQIRKIREERGIKQPDMSLHLVFSGNPGTGKTTVARLLGKIYSNLGILSKGHLIETDRGGLVAGYVGQTAIKTQDMIKEAMGGILFIDEAYALSSSKGENDFGAEAIDTILKAMEDNRDDFIVIVAGYPDLMDEFLHSNPGLESRFNKHLFFEDYNPKELFDIFVSMADESSLKLDEKAEKFLKGHFEDVYNCRGENFANGRYVRNLFEKVISNQANRLVSIDDISDEQLNTLTIEDFEDCI